MVVSPTYFGACADVAALAEVAHSRDVPLIVDEAWGAHLHFHPDLPPDALASGADLVTSSTHKIVGSLTQAAMLHLGHGDRIDPAVVDRCVSLVETTSPSGLLDRARSTRRAGRPPSTATSCSARRWRRSPAPARRSSRSPASPSSTSRWSAAPGSPAGTRCASRSTSAAPARPATGWRKRSSTRTGSTSSSTRRTSSSRSSGSASPPRRPASGWSRRCAPRSANSKPSRARRRRSWRRRRPGASW